MLELAEDRRRFGSPRLYELLRREGLVQNHKSLSGVRVVRVLEKLRLQGRLPQRIKVDNGPEFSGKALDAWAFEHCVQIEFTRPGKPTDNGHIASFTENSGMSA